MVTVNILVLAVLCLVMEWGLKIFYSNPPIRTKAIVRGLRHFYTNHGRKVVQWQPNLARYDEDLSYTLNPGRFVFSNVEYKTTFYVNSLGVRDDEVSLQAPDVIVAGDSHAMGWGVEKEEAFADQLEKMTGLKVLNTAISSYGTVREMKILQQVDISRVKFLVIQYCQNDYEENRKFFENLNVLPIIGKDKFDQVLASHQSDSAYYWGKYIQYLLPSLVRHQLKAFLQPYLFKDEAPAEHEDEAKLFINALVHGGVALDRIEIIVFEINEFNANDNIFVSRLRKEIARGDYPAYIRNIVTLDTSEFLTDGHYYLIDDHMTGKGHRIVAERLSEVIKERY